MNRENADSQTQVIHSSSNGVFGEFLQGIGLDNHPFLITSPIDRYSEASFAFDPCLDRLIVKDLCKQKAQQLVDKIYEKYHLKNGGWVSLQTQFPVGKGLGSSSADLVAVAKVLSKAYALNFTPRDIEDLIRGIEPTDGVMYPGIVSYYYREVKLHKCLGCLKGGMILGVDEGGEIDTVEYNRVKREYKESDKKIYDQLHFSIQNAIRNNDISLLGQISTQSGELNQRFNKKKLFGEFVEISKWLKVPGVVVAHSGTYIGFLLEMTSSEFQKQLNELQKYIGDSGHKAETFYLKEEAP